MYKTILSFILLILFACPAFAQTTTDSPLERKLKGGYLIAVSKEAFDKGVSVLSSKDDEAYRTMANAGLIGETANGREVFIEHLNIFGPTEIRFKGDLHTYWVEQEALYETQSKEDSLNQAQQSNKINDHPGDVVKIDGVMEEKGGPVFFISQNGNVKSVKAGDHLCNGEIIQTYSPGQADGIVDGQGILKYRIKLQLAQHAEIFANGDVVCSE